ncbi:hypothetical protein [Nocardia asiatica]|uniref:hypothetical protein n=1 Tax=Nocardia asiatica TaxID=209252 RepID=UPI00031DAC1F|nr:hypothetical protein [Nocardia asiatica]
MHVNDLEQEPRPEEPDTITLPPQLRGSLAGDLTREQTNEILEEINEHMPQELAYVWDWIGPYGFGGDKRLYFVTSCDMLYVAHELVAWLTLDPTDPNSPETPGDSFDWVGSETWYSAPWPGDDEYNYALEDLRDPERTIETEDRLTELGMPEIDRTICMHCWAGMTPFHGHDEDDEDNAAIRLSWRTDVGGPGGPFALAYAESADTALEDRHPGGRRFPTREAAQAEADTANNAAGFAAASAGIGAIENFAVVIDTRDYLHHKPQN